jgi:AcrR family transcriptional regulator
MARTTRLKAEPAMETGWRGSRDGWLDAAYESLIESGVDAVRILPLSKRLALARTSFYWFFEDRDDLLEALTERWRAKNTGNLIGRTQAYAESITEAVLNVFDCWLDSELFDSRFEFAMRSWALNSEAVSREIAAADAARITALTDMFLRTGYDPLAADTRARTIYLTQIGYITMKSDEQIAARMRRIPQYVEVFTGRAPQERELRRFFARHGFPG